MYGPPIRRTRIDTDLDRLARAAEPGRKKVGCSLVARRRIEQPGDHWRAGEREQCTTGCNPHPTTRRLHPVPQPRPRAGATLWAAIAGVPRDQSASGGEIADRRDPL